VNSSRAYRGAIAFLILVAIAWKIAALPETLNDPKEDLVRFFDRNHFNVVVTDGYTAIIQATMELCHLKIAALSPNGSDRDLIQYFASGTDRLFIVFRGQVYAQQPVWWTELNDLWSRLLRNFGLKKHIMPPIAVAENLSCDAEQLPWGELYDIP